MTCLENNPVLAAYGAVRSGSTAQLQPGERPPVSDDSAAAALKAAGDELRAAAAAVAPEPAAVAPDAAAADAAAPAGEVDGDDPTTAPVQQEMAADAGACAAGNASHAKDQEEDQQAQGSRLVAGLRRRGHTEAADKVERYLQSVLLPNRYGYRPIAQEWDIW